MWREVLRFAGGTLCVLTSVVIFFAFMFRFDGYSEYRWILKVDVVLATAFAFGLLLFTLPPFCENIARYRRLWIPASVLIGVALAGGLISHHYFQYVIRSMPSAHSKQSVE
jgi:hypothetical protein